MKLAPFEKSLHGCSDVPVPIVDRRALCHSQVPLPLLLETVCIFIWEPTHTLFSVHVAPGQTVLPLARHAVWIKPPQEFAAFLNNWFRKGMWPYQGQWDALRFLLRCLSERDTLLLIGFEANSMLSLGIGHFKGTKRKPRSKCDADDSHGYISWIPKSIIFKALTISHQ